jgi:replicative DNA helicase
VAEDMLLALLMKNPDLYEELSEKLKPGDFFNADNRAIFTALTQRLKQNLSTQLANLSGELTTAQMARLSGQLARNAQLKLIPASADDYIRAVLAQKHVKTPDEVREMADGEYIEYIASLQAGKK